MRYARTFVLALCLGQFVVGQVIAGPSTVEVFTDHKHPVTYNEAFADVALKIYHLDGLVRAQEQLSNELPGDEDAAAKLASERFTAERSSLSAMMREAGEGLALAFLTYRLDRYPAIVFDGETVIYGVTDLAVSRQLYEEARETHRP